MVARILVVDDEPHFELIVRKAFRKQINNQEYQFSFALNGIQALQQLEKDSKVDVVLSDINMPEMDGLTLLARLNERYPLIRTVVITAYADMSNIRTAMNGGAFDFLVKPIAMDDLRKTLKKTVDHVAQLHELDAIRKEKERADRDLMDHLKKMDRLKDEFLANISHELNTPLHGIIGIAETLADGVAGPLSDQVIQNLSLVVSSGKRLSALVHDILDFSRLRNSDLELQLRPIRVGSVIQVVLALCRPLLAEKPVQLVNEIPESLALVLADENRLEQILYNLIGNAIKFTDQGYVKAMARDRGAMIEITIEDTGIGIPENKFEAIFNSFEQVDGSTARKYGGSGLGLTITRKLVALHGGTIEAISELGSGSRFTFTLPKSKTVPGREPVQPSPTADPIRPVESLLETELHPGERRQEPELKDEPLGGSFRILIADDEAVNRQILTNRLALQGFTLVPVGDGPAVLDALKGDEEFDLLLLDVMMPGMSGYEVCRAVRKKYSLFDLPILILTAKNQPRDFLEGLASGANDYLAKPFDKRELLARVKTLLTLKQAVRDALVHAQRLAAERQNRELAENLRNLIETLTSTLDMKEVLDRFLESLAEVVGFDHAMVVLAGDHQELVVTRECGVEQSNRYLTILKTKLQSEAYKHQSGLVYDEESSDGKARGIFVPFATHGRLCGLMWLGRSVSEPFDGQAVRLITTFSGQAAIAMENASLFGKVQRLATTDELTGINNRRHFFHQAKIEFDKPARDRRALAAIMIDADHFKKINDTHGHAIGDAVLREISQRIKRICRENDILGRYGGEEFSVLLPGSDLEQATEIANRMRLAVSDDPIGTSDGPLTGVTVSLGVSVQGPGARDLEGLLKQADEALYRAKKNGRNQVVSFTGS